MTRMTLAFPVKQSFKLRPLYYGCESIGGRLARIRSQRGLTQVQLADNIGISRDLVADYERDGLRLCAEMAVRFALALETSVDDLVLPCDVLVKRRPVPVV